VHRQYFVNEKSVFSIYGIIVIFLQVSIFRDQDRLSIESLIKNRLKQVMMTLDLDNCTSKDVRTALEKTVGVECWGLGLS